MLVGCWRRPTQSAEQGRLTDGWWRWQCASNVFDHLADGADHAACGVNKHSWCLAVGQTSASTDGYRRESSVMTSSGLRPAARKRSRKALTVLWSTSLVFGSKV